MLSARAVQHSRARRQARPTAKCRKVWQTASDQAWSGEPSTTVCLLNLLRVCSRLRRAAQLLSMERGSSACGEPSCSKRASAAAPIPSAASGYAAISASSAVNRSRTPCQAYCHRRYRSHPPHSRLRWRAPLFHWRVPPSQYQIDGSTATRAGVLSLDTTESICPEGRVHLCSMSPEIQTLHACVGMLYARARQSGHPRGAFRSDGPRSDEGMKYPA